MNFRRIMVPLDGSPLAETVLAPAVEIARKYGATMLLLRAAEAHTMGADPTEAQVAVVRDTEMYLQTLKTQLETTGISTVETSVWYGPAADAIVEAAHFRKADLIILSSHGRSGLGRLFLGSVAEKVLRASTTPVLVLRPGGAPIATPDERRAREVGRT
jgi:nucleotide-binding universal stress UspA family protein